MSELKTSPRLRLEVRVSGQRVGLLARERHGAIRFTPDAAWLEGGQHPPLGLAFLTDPSPRLAGTGLPSWFDNLLPEVGSALRHRICQQRGLRETDTPSLLLALGRDLPGAVEVLGESEPAALLPEEPVAPGRLRASLAGMQLKLSMLLEGDKFVLPARGETGRWIVKIAGERLPELPQVEHCTMSWAEASGLPVPRHHVLGVETLQGVPPDLLGTPRLAFAVERFDRSVDGSRIHQEDFAQALEIDARAKYADTGPRRTSYDALARLVKDVCGEDAQAQFLDRVAFTIASGNDDAHLKNWSFQWGFDHRPRLSPCYDFVASISWPAFGWESPHGPPKLALALGRSRRFDNLDRERLRLFAQRADVPDGEERMLAALERARATWAAIEDQSPARMREAVRLHWSRVPVLRSLGGLPSSTRTSRCPPSA